MTVRELEEEINPKPKEKIATADIEKLLNREKYNSVYKEVIFMGKERYLKYFKRK